MSNRYEIYNIKYVEFCEICWLPKLCTTFSSEKWVSSSRALNSIACAVLTQKFSAKYRARNQTKRNRFTKCDKYKVSLKNSEYMILVSRLTYLIYGLISVQRSLTPNLENEGSMQKCIFGRKIEHIYHGWKPVPLNKFQTIFQVTLPRY